MSSLEAELERALAERARLDVVIAYLRERLDQSEKPEAPQRRRSRSAGRLTAADAAEQVLRETGEPMRTPELLAAIQEAGARMKDTDSLYKTLTRSPDRFKRSGRGLWTLSP